MNTAGMDTTARGRRSNGRSFARLEDGPHAESGELARKLVEAGFTKVTVLDEGLGVWKQRNYPTRTGDKP
jgi:hypothetical protein